ncbi:hypothetical protein DIS24_g11161 [Lasiodiplodia hormozganensis]|uniref:Uncharacterized protein n=1 Tax=Lasiodiplodia hormozganensis TaxID=869390 RepID=A0AA39WZH1_9PEZI|nr:hypothetical protein DIS24_g11161 [Lasiodiplodia hormozganensis]
MHFSLVGACFLLAATLGQASPVEPQPRNVSNDLFWLSKRCCILCDNPYARCGEKDKREPVDSLGEALFGPVKRDEAAPSGLIKRCCILCDNPHVRCGSNDKREAVNTLEEALFGAYQQ